MNSDFEDARVDRPDLEEERVHAVVAARLFGEGDPTPRVGRFTVLEKVGHGGMGDVYAAYDPQLDRRVALKLLHRESSDDRLLREARTMASINHPNVAQVYEVGLAGDRVFIAMEFVRGETLRAWRNRAPRGWREILALYRQAACGLVAAHTAGVVHRDFKPDNALVGEDGRVRVVDFGLARVEVHSATVDSTDVFGEGTDGRCATLTAASSIAGTPAYMAPEQFEGSAVDEWSDQFSFCVALHEALHGSRPYPGTSAAGILAMIRVHAIDRGSLDKSIPDWIVRTIVRGLSPDPRARHPSMGALIDALDRDPSRRRRWSLALLAAGLAGAGTLVWQQAAMSRAAAECESQGQVVIDVWNPARAVELEQAFVATDIPYARDTWRRLEPRLTAWADAWASASTQACVSERIDDTLGSRVAQDARECLGEQLTRFSTILEQLGQPSPEVLRRAPSSVAVLPSSDRCLDERALSRRSRPSPEQGQDAAHQVRRELARAEALLSTASYGDALTIAEGALRNAESLGWPLLLAEARRTMGLIQRDMGQFEAARESLEQAFYLAGASGHDHVAVSAANGLVQTVGFRLADHDEGLHWVALGRMHADRIGVTSENPDVATLLVSASTIHIGRGDYEKAQAALEQALEIQMRSLGGEHQDVANTLVNLAALHHTRGAYDQALAMFEKAFEKKERILGSEHPDVAMLLSNIAVVHNTRGAYAQALETHQRALHLREEALGPNHPDVAASLVNIGNVLFQQAAYAEALTGYERALAVQRETLGPRHPDVAKSLGGIAKVHYSRGEYDEAIAAAEESLAAAEAALGPDHAEVGEALNRIAVMHQARGAVPEAIVAQQRALAIWEKALGAEHPLVAMALANIGAFHRILGEYEAALEAQQKALGIREHRLGADHTDVAASLTNIGNVHADLGQDEDALSSYERALTIYEKALGSDHPLVATVLEGIASIHLRRDAYAEAVASHERALTIREQAQSTAADLATARFGLAQALAGGRVDRRRARALAEQAHHSFVELGPSTEEQAREVEAWLSRH
jgi:eukaryotic-like serine/threonine-protein kinase